MLQAGGHPDFLEEPGRADGGSQLGVEDLQGDAAVVLEITR